MALENTPACLDGSREPVVPPSAPVTFRSILYEKADRSSAAPVAEPDYFRDLNLDQIVDAITAGKQDYDLKPFFYDRLNTVSDIRYRQDVMRDIAAGPALAFLKEFMEGMRLTRRQKERADKLYHTYQKERWLLHAVSTYCRAVRQLQRGLSRLALASRGLLAFCDYLTGYVASENFVGLSASAERLTSDLARIEYCVLLRGGSLSVRACSGEPDYSREIADVFSRFRQGAVKDYQVEFRTSPNLNSIEEKILEFVALLNRDVFQDLEQFCLQNSAFTDAALMAFDREVQFYVAYTDYVKGLERTGLEFCYPFVSDDGKDVYSKGGFDLALAAKLAPAGTAMIRNSFRLLGKERVLVISGPNQGGKTTFARAFGQMHHLACLGCPVPGTSAKTLLFDSLFTHFEKEESPENLQGKLHQDLTRIHGILGRATPRSVIILNEIFSSTTLRDAVFLARMIMGRIIELDLLCVCVTFLDELASTSEKTVSMVSTVVPETPAIRTFRIVRRPADGRTYAISIAEKYRLTYDCLLTRIES